MTMILTDLPTAIQRSDFASDFLWGVSTSAYQIEGAAAEDGRVPSIWDTFSATPGKVRDGSSGAVACDHYHRWEEDLDLAQSMGLNSYRFSIAWPRIFNGVDAEPNAKGLAFYSKLVDGMLARGLQPWCTLYHWDLPQYLEDQGGWANRATIAAFLHYADVISKHLGDRVQHWITHNEPWCTAMHGNWDGMHAPGNKSLPLALQVCHNVLVSHGLAVPLIRANVPGAKVGIALSLHPVKAASDSAADQQAVVRHDALRNRWFLDSLYGRGYPELALQLVGQDAPQVLPGDMEAIAAPMDFLGVNYYFPEVVKDAPDQYPLRTSIVYPQDRQRTDFGWEVSPQGLVELLERVARDYPTGDLYVTENGSSYDDHLDADGAVNDTARRDYLIRHLAAVRDAIAAGGNIKGYFAWSLLDNFEWAEGYLRRFGLTYIDYPTQGRILKQSGQWYSAFLREA
ncbi:GH1 family beta-glucosidase [Duganella violaceipulchra]|uniref:Beta-glucosidase n=1 Tax=Duganella violaceipulchra TaxID=2849652 RepID=A0AA41HHT2_9BURK|nr:GH1 family beta-glucosidase [Duganella violaceicalia]MBV6324411.1 beta-glucosidase [Duganella violaceicalia]MCP2012014.1 beta-glucosidase [Duganella violaceicalia]